MLKKESKLWILLSFILIVVLFYVLGKHAKDLEKIIAQAGIFGPVVTIIFFGLLAPTPISTDPFTAVSGVLFGPVGGIIVSWLGNNLAATVEYLVGERIAKKMVGEEKVKLPFGLNRLPVGSPWVLVLGRTIPGYGGKIISLMAGIYRVPLQRYLWTTALVNLVGSILLSYGGYHLLWLLRRLI